jgi:repressor LexA
MTITKRQKEVLDFISGYQDQHGVPPSIREICAGLGLKSPGSMYKILTALEREGYLEASKGKKRSCRIKGKRPAGRVPLLGRIAAGIPIDAVENVEEELPVDPGIFGVSECFALRVQGDSMAEAHIDDGDIAIIYPQDYVENGQIAAVIVANLLPEATLKIVRRNKDSIELHSANSRYPPMVFQGSDAEKVRIIGKYVGIIRRK